MAFTIILQTNLSENHKVDKTINNLFTATGELKLAASIIDPVVVIQASLPSLVNCNYATISAFGRSYFVTNIVSVNNALVEVHCHVDVLSSFAEQLRRNSAIIYRQENKWNLYLNDGSFRIYQNPNVLTREFPSGFNTQEFVLAVAGS